MGFVNELNLVNLWFWGSKKKSFMLIINPYLLELRLHNIPFMVNHSRSLVNKFYNLIFLFLKKLFLLLLFFLHSCTRSPHCFCCYLYFSFCTVRRMYERRNWISYEIWKYLRLFYEFSGWLIDFYGKNMKIHNFS